MDLFLPRESLFKFIFSCRRPFGIYFFLEKGLRIFFSVCSMPPPRSLMVVSWPMLVRILKLTLDCLSCTLPVDETSCFNFSETASIGSRYVLFFSIAISISALGFYAEMIFACFVLNHPITPQSEPGCTTRCGCTPTPVHLQLGCGASCTPRV